MKHCGIAGREVRACGHRQRAPLNGKGISAATDVQELQCRGCLPLSDYLKSTRSSPGEKLRSQKAGWGLATEQTGVSEWGAPVIPCLARQAMACQEPLSTSLFTSLWAALVRRGTSGLIWSFGLASSSSCWVPMYTGCLQVQSTVDLSKLENKF